MAQRKTTVVAKEDCFLLGVEKETIQNYMKVK